MVDYLIKKVTNNLENFSYNKIVANLHEMHSFISKQVNKNYKKETLIENYQKILITMQPVIPHFANECLELINSKKNKWPEYNEALIKDDIVNIVVQINGKKRGLIKSKPNMTEENFFEIIKNDEKLSNLIGNKIIKRKIYIKDKLMNIII